MPLKYAKMLAIVVHENMKLGKRSGTCTNYESLFQVRANLYILCPFRCWKLE